MDHQQTTTSGAIKTGLIRDKKKEDGVVVVEEEEDTTKTTMSYIVGKLDELTEQRETYNRETRSCYFNETSQARDANIEVDKLIRDLSWAAVDMRDKLQDVWVTVDALVKFRKVAAVRRRHEQQPGGGGGDGRSDELIEDIQLLISELVETGEGDNNKTTTTETKNYHKT